MARLTLGDILELARRFAPTSLTDAQLVTYLNQVQQEKFRLVDFPVTRQEILLRQDVDTYTLPCPPDRLRSIALQSNRRILTTAEVTAYIGQPVNDYTVIYDLDGDGDIDAADVSFLTAAGGTMVLNSGTEARYEFVRDSFLLNGNTFTTISDTQYRLACAPSFSFGSLLGISIIDTGTGYTSAPTISLPGGAEVEVAVAGGMVTAITVTKPGFGLLFPPVVTFTGGGGTGATGYAIIDNSRLVLTYSPSPTDFTVSNLSQIPFTPSDYDMMYVHELAKYIGLLDKDTEVVGIHQAAANEQTSRLMKHEPRVTGSIVRRMRW